MKTYETKDMRNVVLCGHGSKGKTTLAEAMLYLSKATDRLGRVADGSTVMDYDNEEKKRKVSVATAVAALEWQDKKINLIDTPGLFDYAQGLSEGMRAGETALIVLSAKSGLSVGAEKAFQLAGKRNMARFFIATKMDGENADFYKTFNGIVMEYGSAVCPLVVPVLENGTVVSYYNMIEQKAYTYQGGRRAEAPMPEETERFAAIKMVFSEAIASCDDALLEKFFDGEAFTREEIVNGLKKGISDGLVYPVIACSGYTTEGVDTLLDVLAEVAPAPRGEYGTGADGEPVSVSCDPDAPLAAVAFKTIADPFIGKLSFFKVISGKLAGDSAVLNARTGEAERMGKVVFLFGGKQTDVPCIAAGDIGAVTKLANVATGDTLCSPGRVITLDGVASPAPCLSMAVNAKKKGEEEKATAGLLRLIEEDPALSFAVNKETNEQILSGLGEQHLDVVVSKLKNKFGVEVNLSVPKVAYRETITKKVSVHGRHKKQSGGHGQFGDIWVEFTPCDGEDLVFEERVVGGAVPKNFFPAVEKGLRDCVQKGILAGYPMVGLKATLYDGSYHPVDSSEMSFKMAAAIAYKNGIPQAGPAILEPIGSLKVLVNDEVMGDIIGDINKRRGRVLGMNSSEEHMQEIIAEVPMAEMTNFSTTLRQATQGRGSFTFKQERYEKAPEHIAQKVIEAAQAEE